MYFKLELLYVKLIIFIHKLNNVLYYINGKDSKFWVKGINQWEK